MREIDRLHTQYPFAGVRTLRSMLRQDDWHVGRKHLGSLMKRMGVDALYRKPKTTRKNPAHRVYPYLLRGLGIDRPNQVWAMDITYIPMSKGFVYLAVVMDWFSRCVLSWRLSISMDVDFCVEALEEAVEKYGKPEIMNTDQGSQFTSTRFTGLLETEGIKISMDGKGAWRDNIFVERLWRSVKYEEIYLHAHGSVSEVKTALNRYFKFYNEKRPHSSLQGNTPDQVYLKPLSLPVAT